jgi:hypothetical protein
MDRYGDFDAVRDHPKFLSMMAKARTKIATTTA